MIPYLLWTLAVLVCYVASGIAMGRITKRSRDGLALTFFLIACLGLTAVGLYSLRWIA